MIHGQSILIYGNSLSSIVAAIELSKNNHAITLVNPSKSFGGHFQPLIFNNEYFDPGMVLYEFDSFNKDLKADLNSYNPFKKNDSGRFVSLIKQYISKCLKFDKIDTPKAYFEGVIINDFLISNHLEVINYLTESDKKTVMSQLEFNIENNKNKHPSLKSYNDDFIKFSFHDLSKANHGSFLHNKFFEPFCNKTLNISSKEIIGTYHRVAWLPLFYPESLYDAINNNTYSCFTTSFHYPSNSYATKLTEFLEKQSQNLPNISIKKNKTIRSINFSSNCFEVNLLDSNNVNTFSAKYDRLVWASGLANFNKLFDSNYSKDLCYKKTSIGLLLLVIKPSQILRKFSLLNIVDSKFSIYRITNQSKCANNEIDLQRLSIEFNLNYFNSIYENKFSDGEVIDTLLSEIQQMGIVEVDVKEMKNSIKLFKFHDAILLPTKENLSIYNEEKELFNKNKINTKISDNIQLIGQGAGFYSTSLNDLILQGLKLGID